MMLILTLLLALAALSIGAELLVHGASRLATMFGISQLVIGLTVVSFGTSAPEFVVSIKAALANHPDLVVGNCVGSNIFNLLFIIGACAVVIPLIVANQLIKVDIPIMIGAHLLFLLVSRNGLIDRYDALLLLAAFAAYYSFMIRKSLQENASTVSTPVEVKRSLSAVIKQIGFVAIGLIMCIVGADALVDSATTLARILGVSELVIGLTIVSIGTSLPELATSFVATIRGQRDIAIGNVVGSSIFNILGVIGVAGLIAPNGIIVAPSILRVDLPVAIGASIACFLICFTDRIISRWEGLLFLFYYGAYTTYLILEAQTHAALPLFSLILLWFVIPVSAVTLGYRFIRSVKH